MTKVDFTKRVAGLKLEIREIRQALVKAAQEDGDDFTAGFYEGSWDTVIDTIDAAPWCHP